MVDELSSSCFSKIESGSSGLASTLGAVIGPAETAGAGADSTGVAAAGWVGMVSVGAAACRVSCGTSEPGPMASPSRAAPAEGHTK